jgi:peptidoglycan/xylan/chitin deacetylase (PgdA/CDA1 family)
MKIIKESFDNNIPKLIEKIGCFVNPLILNFKNENNQLLAFFFHGLFKSQEQKDLNHIDPQNNMMVSQFVDFIEYFLNHNYKFVSPEDLLAGLKNNQPYAMITFDDGYYNNMLAFEILDKYKIPAVIFITTNNMTENKSFWWDIIYKYRTRQGSTVDAIRQEQRTLKSYKHFIINEYIIDNFGIESFTPWSDIDRPFNENEVKNLAKSPYISIGNHTHNHSILTNYTEEERKEELRQTNKILFDLTGKSPISIAFPNGNYDNSVIKSVEEEGFRFAFNTESKKNILPLENSKLICLNRYITDTTKINKSGSFRRLDYEPDKLYANMKIQMKLLLKRKRS